VLILLGGAVLFAPLLLGATGEWPRLGVEVAMGLAVMIWAASSRRSWLAAAIPFAVTVPFLLQLAPLPDRLLDTLAPISAAAWKVAADGKPGVMGRISITPSETLAGCCRLFLGVATIAAVADVARKSTARWWLLSAVAISACTVLALGLIFPVGYEEKILLGTFDLKGPLEFWRSPLPPPAQTAGWAYLESTRVGDVRYPVDLRLVGDGFGPYISSNEFAAAIYLGLPAVLAALLVLMRNRLPVGLRFLTLAMVAAGAAWVVGGMAHSRAGAASLVMGVVAFATLAAETPLSRRIGGVASGLLAAALLVFALAFYGFLGGFVDLFPDTWQAKLAQLGSDGRATATHAALRMFRASPFLGTGLGSYGDLYARIVGNKQVQYFAHNDYAQFLAEGGLLAAVTILTGAGILAVACKRYLARPPGEDRIVGAAAWAALAALGVHSAFDWNMHVPANALLACVMAGLALSTGIRPREEPAGDTPPRAMSRWLATAGVVGGCLLALAVLARAAASEAACRTIREAIVADQLASKDASHGDPAPILRAALARGERAAATDPANAYLAMGLGQLNLHLAARTTASADKEAYRAAATPWFNRARRNGAAVRGFPESAAQR
jgi:O-antigen ligase